MEYIFLGIVLFFCAASLGGLVVYVLLTPKLKKYMALARIDDLTKLYNSREFKYRLENEAGRAKRYHKPLSLILIDLDGLKSLNEEYGYVAGDTLLTEFAQFLESVSRTSDILFRYRLGDEFAVLLPETPEESARVFAARLYSDIRKHRLNLLYNKPITISIGLASLNGSKDTIPSLQQRAESRLGKAKNEKK
ncbi:MAG: diguanylate cyclase [Kiritimatiellae bacterium]|nr:diguanylate cyclase [Kiritimatiellia bacterium]